MYLAIVILLMFVLPIGSVAIDRVFLHADALPVLLMGKWFVFWSVGVRLSLAGVRQFFQPGFTAREIFAIESIDAFPLVRELGVANFATGVVGVASLFLPSFTVPAAISASLFYGIAGVRHVAQKARTRNETIAMVSDLFVCAVLATFLGATMLGACCANR